MRPAAESAPARRDTSWNTVGSSHVHEPDAAGAAWATSVAPCAPCTTDWHIREAVHRATGLRWLTLAAGPASVTAARQPTPDTRPSRVLRQCRRGTLTRLPDGLRVRARRQLHHRHEWHWDRRYGDYPHFRRYDSLSPPSSSSSSSSRRIRRGRLMRAASGDFRPSLARSESARWAA